MRAREYVQSSKTRPIKRRSSAGGGSQDSFYLFHLSANLGGIHEEKNNVEVGSGNIAGYTGANQFKFTSGTRPVTGNGRYYPLPAPLTFDGDFGVDLWINPIQTDGNLNGILSAGIGYNPMTVLGFSTTWRPTFWNNANFVSPTLASATALTAGVMQHFACTRSGNTVRMFINGVVVATGTVSGAVNFGAGGASFIFGHGQSGSGGSCDAYVDELRICKWCPWDAAFTPPTAPYTS